MIPTNEAVTANWNAYSEVYSAHFERNNVPFAVSLANMLQLKNEQPKQIVEVACGPGGFSRYLSQNLQHECSVSAIDIAQEMVDICQSLSKKYPSLSNVKVEYSVGDAENLTSIPDSWADVYIANLCIHLTSDPKKMLDELKRVLNKGSRFGLSVLGPSDKVTFLSFFPTLLKELEEEIPALKPQNQTRSVFHLGKKEDLLKLVEDAGLQVDFCWYQRGCFACSSLEEYENVILSGPANKKLMQSLKEEERNRVLEAFRTKLQKEYLDKKEPLMLETLLLTGRYA